MFKHPIEINEGLLMMQPRSDRLDAGIHMLFMNFDIAVIWLDDNLVVVDTRLCRRWHPAYLPSVAARYVLEAHAARKDDFYEGDQLFLEPCKTES